MCSRILLMEMWYNKFVKENFNQEWQKTNKQFAIHIAKHSVCRNTSNKTTECSEYEQHTRIKTAFFVCWASSFSRVCMCYRFLVHFFDASLCPFSATPNFSQFYAFVWACRPTGNLCVCMYVCVCVCVFKLPLLRSRHAMSSNQTTDLYHLQF
jgi:hypothetical protein